MPTIVHASQFAHVPLSYLVRGWTLSVEGLPQARSLVPLQREWPARVPRPSRRVIGHLQMYPCSTVDGFEANDAGIANEGARRTPPREQLVRLELNEVAFPRSGCTSRARHSPAKALFPVFFTSSTWDIIREKFSGLDQSSNTCSTGS